MRLSGIRATGRRVLLPVFARLNPGDITIRNHRTRDSLRLHSFRHKGYWFYGRRREAATMELFGRLIRPGDRVAEVGGHIGYISQYFAHLVGDSGEVVVFEPGPNNLPYLLANTSKLKQVRVVQSAVGERPGQATLYVEDLTGQNNSMIQDFQGLAINAEAAGLHTTVSRVEVVVTTLDEQFVQPPDFIKVDVEGFELPVLRGAQELLTEHQPLLMVEIQADHAAIRELAEGHGYTVVNEGLEVITWDGSWSGNTFWFHGDRHGELLAGLQS